MKKYLVLAGKITSKHDGDTHQIGGLQLARLYGVDHRECYFAREDDELLLRSLRSLAEGLIVLRPRYEGDYREYLMTQCAARGFPIPAG